MDTIEKLVDLLETQEPECVVTVNTGYTYEDDEGQDHDHHHAPIGNRAY